jgi:hypothetical protein
MVFWPWIDGLVSEIKTCLYVFLTIEYMKFIYKHL